VICDLASFSAADACAQAMQAKCTLTARLPMFRAWYDYGTVVQMGGCAAQLLRQPNAKERRPSQSPPYYGPLVVQLLLCSLQQPLHMLSHTRPHMSLFSWQAALHPPHQHRRAALFLARLCACCSWTPLPQFKSAKHDMRVFVTQAHSPAGFISTLISGQRTVQSS
jgi:hypothetical protein